MDDRRAYPLKTTKKPAMSSNERHRELAKLDTFHDRARATKGRGDGSKSTRKRTRRFFRG